MYISRLNELDQIVSNYRQQIFGKEKALSIAPVEEKERIKLQISDLKKEMEPFEKEYWTILSRQSVSIEIPEEEAEIVVAEICEEIEKINLSTAENPIQIVELLSEIKKELKQLNKPASAKIKGVISIIPPYFGVLFEPELDLGTFLERNFPTFNKIINMSTKKKQIT
ncbi:hypothetical protein [Synechococcus sp. PCC 6312]|uniref:hypothetical protein n=1 Tax=Synechococcus sp. (strain ATCC 27167 / PCC 6312) TaxID=195253 RepID=UPI00029F4A56|nr:hypothetical protein [Synechococcus sp. PCC 6312]AFY62524.1 hypothetical protein Syn6312_3498 [Synechococcus sp. PCC 6312]